MATNATLAAWMNSKAAGATPTPIHKKMDTYLEKHGEVSMKIGIAL
jgi:hypothetical protein